MAIFDPRNFGANPNDTNDDTFAIQAALDAARDAGGGQVILSAGTYILTGGDDASDGGIRIYSNTEISGAGMGQTILKVADGWSDKISGMIRTPVNEVTENVIIRDITLDGNRHNVDAHIDGIQTGVLPGKDEHDNNILIERVEIHDVSRIAFNPHEQTHNLTIRDSVAHHNSWDGFIADWVVNGVYENNIAYANDRHGFNLVTHTNNVVVRDNIAYDNAQQGIVLQRGSGSTTVDGWEDLLNHDILVTNNTVYNNGKNGILLKQVENNQIIGNVVYGNAEDGIQIEGANNNLIANNEIIADVHGIRLKPYSGSFPGPDTAFENLIINNTISAKGDTLKESGSSSVDNTYAGNNVTEISTSLNESATLLESSDEFSYDLLQISADFPTTYGIEPSSEPVTSDGFEAEIPQTLIPVKEEDVETDASPAPEENLASETPALEGQFVSGDDSNNTLEGGSFNDTIKGRGGDDILIGGKGDDRIEGNDGDDIITGGEGADTLKGSNGTDTFAYNNINEGGDIILDFKALEKIDLTNIAQNFVGFLKENAFTKNYVQLSQNGDDVDVYVDADGIDGNTNATHLVTLENVTVTSLGEVNFILPEEGLPIPTNTPLPISRDDQFISGDSGNNTLAGGIGDDTIKGRDGDDTLTGGAGNDTIQGNAGDDIITGGAGADTLKGSAGTDTFIYNDINEGGDIILDFRSSETIDIAAITIHNDAITTNNLFTGGYVTFVQNGSDTVISIDIDGQTGNGEAQELVTLKDTDTSYLSEDNFNVHTQEARESFTSMVDYSNSGNAVHIDLKNTDNPLLAGVNDVTGSNTTTGRDWIWGNDNANKISGLNGRDIIEGGAGADTIDGGDGWDYARYTRSDEGVNVNLETNVNTGGDAEGDALYNIEAVVGSNHDDIITGGAGNDYLNGENGDDVLNGGDGVDALYGGNGNDTFLFEATHAYNGVDHILDFNADDDNIDISDVLEEYDPVTDAILDFVQITTDGTNSFISIDANGGGDNFVTIAQVNGVTTLDVETMESDGSLIV